MVEPWACISYFNAGTARARQCMAELEFVERANWFELYRRKADGSHWRLDADDKYQQGFLVQIESLEGWATFDASPLEKALLLEHRGGYADEVCVQQGCNGRTLRGSAYCLDHTFEHGVRK